MHITYKYRKHVIILEQMGSTRTILRSPLDFVENRINELRREEAVILRTCVKLSNFLRANAITPFNDDMTEYLRYFIREEKMKQNAGADNAEVIRGLEEMVTNYTREADLMKKTLASQSTGTSNAIDLNGVSDINDIFDSVQTLYELPINGDSIRQQVEGLKRLQTQTKTRREHEIPLPVCAASSIIMKQLQGIILQDQYEAWNRPTWRDADYS